MKCEGDVVMVIYNGHGFNDSNTKTYYDASGEGITYPNLILNYERPTKKEHFINYRDVLCQIEAKKPAMVFLLFQLAKTKSLQQLNA